MRNKKQQAGDLGQHWTPAEIVDLMVGMLETKKGAVLEPTAGSGRFIRRLEEKGYDAKGVEIDPGVIPSDIRDRYEVSDFFAWEGEKFNAIIGNPPYVNGRLAEGQSRTWQGELPPTANLYLQVIEKCVKQHLREGGEIVFIVPSTMMSGTSLGSALRTWMTNNGAFTHLLRPRVQWEAASVDTCIFRWVKGASQGKVKTSTADMNLHISNGMVKLINFEAVGNLGSFFSVGVGAAPSAKLMSDSAAGSPFISGGMLKYYNISNTGEWPRWRLTGARHKILVMPGPTRKPDVFYTTLDWDVSQAARHTDHFLIPKKQINDNSLREIAIRLNEFMLKYGEMLSMRTDGRWSAGIKDLENIPIDAELHDFLVSCGL